MRTKLSFAILPVAIILTWFFAGDSEQLPPRGPHGGQIKAVDNYYVEMKSDESTIYAYLLDRNKLAVRNGNVKCEVRLLFADSSIFEVKMEPFGTEGYYGLTAAQNYNLCLVTFTIFNAKISAAFKNNTLLVSSEH